MDRFNVCQTQSFKQSFNIEHQQKQRVEGIVNSKTHGVGVRICVNPADAEQGKMLKYRMKYVVQTDPYRPCSCGSGKKYKFCCKGKKNV